MQCTSSSQWTVTKLQLVFNISRCSTWELPCVADGHASRIEYCQTSVLLWCFQGSIRWLRSGEGNAVGRLGSRDKKEHRPHQPPVHHPHVLCFAAASALSADPQGAQGPPAIPLGQIRDAVQFVCGAHLSSVTSGALESQVPRGKFLHINLREDAI